jgi:hypothetical protein
MEDINALHPVTSFMDTPISHTLRDSIKGIGTQESHGDGDSTVIASRFNKCRVLVSLAKAKAISRKYATLFLES